MDELEVLRMRDEVLQAMYWMRSEGISQAPSAEELGRFMAVPRSVLDECLQRFVADGLLDRDGPAYRLSAMGEERGKRTFADEMADLTRPTHGECDDDCWCHDSPDAAASCLEERRGHVHTR